MKFYFCETCGKRLTEDDIERGAARNKKLKGVYCDGCANGVTTLDTIPMSDKEARDILQEAPPTSKSSVSSKRKSSKAVQLPGTRRRTTSSRSMSAKTHDQPGLSETTGSQRRVHLTIGLLAGAALLVVAALLVLGGSGENDGGTSRRSTKRELKGETSLPVEPAAKAPADKTVIPDQSIASPETKEETADAAFDTALRQFEKLDAKDLAAREAVLRGFLDEHGDSVVAARARTMLEKLKQSASTSTPKSEPSTSKTTGTEAEPRRPPGTTAEAGSPATKTSETDKKPGEPTMPPRPSIGASLTKVIAALRENDFEQARSSALGTEQGRSAAELKLAEAVDAVKAREEAYRRGLEARIGKTIALQIAGKLIRGKLGQVKDGTLSIEQVFMINGKPKGSTVHVVKLSDLSPAQRESLCPLPAPTTDDQWICRVMTQLKEADTSGAKESIASVQDHPAKDALSALILASWSSEREAQAAKQWVELKARAEGKLSGKQAHEFAEKIRSFEKEFEATAFLKDANQTSERRKVSESVRLMALAMDPRVLKVFRGKVTDWDARTRRLSVSYDFSSKDQFQDFEGTIPSAVKFVKGGVYQRVIDYGWKPLKMPRFHSRDLSLTIVFSKHKLEWGRCLIHVGFWLPEKTKGKTRLSFCINRADYSLTQDLIWRSYTYRKAPTVVLKKNPRSGELPETIRLALKTGPGSFSAKLNDQVILQQPLERPPTTSGFCIGGVGISRMTINAIHIAGHLDPEWLAGALAKAKAKKK